MDVNKLREFLTYNPETGNLTWVKAPNDKTPKGKIAGYKAQSGYIIVGYNKKEYRAHRLAWLLHTGEQPPKFLDHADGVRHNNKWYNLREATKQENSRNRIKRVGCSSDYKGVSWCKKSQQWKSYITVAKKYIHLGNFASEEEAAKTYDKLATELFNSFAKQNFTGDEFGRNCKFE